MTTRCVFMPTCLCYHCPKNPISTKTNKFFCPTSSSMLPSAAYQWCCVDKKQPWWPVSCTHPYHPHTESPAGSWLRCRCTLKPLQARYVGHHPRMFGSRPNQLLAALGSYAVMGNAVASFSGFIIGECL